MTNYILKRLGQGLLTVFLTVSTVFILIRLAPGDPAVSYAGPLASNEQLAAVREQLSKAVGRSVTLATAVDPNLLGGLVVRVGSRMIDASLRTKLQRLETAMRGVA